MNLLLSCQDISKSYGGRQLFSDLSFGIFRGNKIGLIGPNGSGKSTLLKILAKIDPPETGTITFTRTLKIGYVPQETLFSERTLHDLLFDALHHETFLTNEEKEVKVAKTLSQFGLTDPLTLASSLSGGWQKRLAIALEFIHSPDLILLDEPTNHLDLEGVIWLEKFLRHAPFAYVVISHDRYFLENVCNRIMELNKIFPKGLFSTDGSYSTFIERREEFLSGQLQQERSLASKVRREVEWLKQNPKARTTKSQSRVQEAHRLIQDLQEFKTRHKESSVHIDFSSSKRESQKLLVATNLAKSMGGRSLFTGIDLTLTPGTRLGIVGSNGSGKTTFLRLLAGELTPDKGTIKYAEGIKIVYFDQHRAQLPSDISLRRALAPENDTIHFQGKSIHVNAWCRRFLFSPDRLDLPFGQLSGGEKARVHIARLMLQPADILLLDEPTNDLDIPTLEILEQSLLDFPGAIVLISHDRYLLDQVSTVILGLGSGNKSGLYADYYQWEEAQQSIEKKEKIEKKESPPRKEEERTRKMSYAEKREWEQMEEKILAIEGEIARLQSSIQHSTETDQAIALQQACQELDIQQKKLDQLYQRWQELEMKQ